jgi:hypothetical protein
VQRLLGELPGPAIDAIIAAVGPDSGRGQTLSMLQFRHMGGALAREAPGAGARATLPGEINMYTLGVVLDETSHAGVRAAVADVEAAVQQHRVGHYPNFVEEPTDASAFFAPEVWARLRAIKSRYDGDDMFAGNHHIPPAT